MDNDISSGFGSPQVLDNPKKWRMEHPRNHSRFLASMITPIGRVGAMSRYWGEPTPTDQSWDEPPSIYVFFAQRGDLKYTQMSHKRPKLDEETNYLAGWMMRIHV